MLVTSRSFDEYVAMFALGPDDLSRSVLDCSAGASGFVASAARAGARAVAVDPAYAMSRTELAEQARVDMARGHGIAAEFADRFTWRWYGTAERREQLRQAALAQFVTDVVSSPRRYVAGQLPQLPFVDASFDLALCSHLLFTWADELGLDWHLAALRELVRVAREVRVFPTIVQGRGEPVPFWDDLMAALCRDGITAELRRVGYEFQVGGDQMLVVGSGSGSGT